jgi:MFS family permease
VKAGRVAWHTLIGGFLGYGFDAVDCAVLALALPMIITEWRLTLGEAGLIGTAGMLGVGLSGVLMGWLADNQGRRHSLLFSVVLFALFTAGAALAQHRWQLMLVRAVAGVGLGGVWGAVTALVNETWPSTWRGRAVTVLLSAWPIGMIGAALLSGWVLPNFGWRALFLCGALALVAALYVLCLVPESALWRQGRTARPAPADAARHGGRGLRPDRLLGREHLVADLPDPGARPERNGDGALWPI